MTPLQLLRSLLLAHGAREQDIDIITQLICDEAGPTRAKWLTTSFPSDKARELFSIHTDWLRSGQAAHPDRESALLRIFVHLLSDEAEARRFLHQIIRRFDLN